MPPVLQNLSLLAYRGISSLVLQDLAPVSLVVGANNAGKSTILEAAGLVLRPPDPAQWISAVRHRDIDMSLVDGLWALFPAAEAFHPEDGPQESSAIELEGTTAGLPRKVQARCHVSQSLGTTEIADLSARIEVNVDGDPALTLKFPSPAVVAHEVPIFRVFTVMPATHYSTKALVEHLSRVVDEGKKQLAVHLLQVFDPDVEDLDVIASLGREAVRVTHRTRGVVDLASFGDGMRRSAALALALTRASQGVLLIDEIEAGIHHTVLRQVLGKLLVVVHKAERVIRMEDLTTDHIAWMKTFSWPLPASSTGTDIGRFSVPAPTFYKLGSGAIVALRSAEGIEKIFSTLERDLESFARTSGDPQTVGILLDSDKKTSQERLRELKEQLARLELDIPDHLGSVSDGVPRIGVFAVPEPGVEGTLEDLLMMIGDVSYPELAQSARAYADGWSDKAKAGLSGSEWKPIKKPAGAKKAAIAAMAAILKPGKSTQVSLEDNRWVTEETTAVPGLQPCIAFLNALLATVAPAPQDGPSAPALGDAL